jgi:pyruvate dehydrogenase E1 component alpha subunit
MSITTITMPHFGQTTGEGTLVAWLKNEGDRIERGEPLADIETDKTIVQAEAHVSGYLRRILQPAGSVVVAGDPIALLSSLPEEPLVERSETRLPKGPAVAEQPKRQATGTKDPISLYEMLVRIRRFEERVYYLFLEGSMPGTIHLYLGQEAVAVGLCANLRTDDYVTSTHRAHGHALAKGVSPRALMAELFGKATGCCGGKGGSMHVGDMRVGMVPSIAVVGAGIPIAAGLALAAKRRKTGQVAICFFGDGAANEGVFHEGINLAAIWDLPVVFVCENNLYGASTHISKVMKVANVADRAAAYGIPGIVADGNDVVAVSEAAAQAVDRARNGGGPTLLECKTYRQSGHSRSDPGNYRSKEEVAFWKERDPLVIQRRRLLGQRLLDEAGLAALEARVELEIEDAVAFARSSPEPGGEEMLRHVYGE